MPMTRRDVPSTRARYLTPINGWKITPIVVVEIVAVDAEEGQSKFCLCDVK